MAKPTWITTDKVTGNCSGSISISASPHTGREPRTGVVTIKNQMGTRPSKTVTVNQAAKPIFLDVKDSPSIFEVPTNGGSINVTIITNAQAIEVNEEGYSTSVICTVGGKVIEKSNSATGTSTANIYRMTGQEGVSEEYTINLELKFASMDEVYDRESGLILTPILDNGSNGLAYINSIVQRCAPSRLSVLPESLALVTAGTAQTVAVTSNDDWDVL